MTQTDTGNGIQVSVDELIGLRHKARGLKPGEGRLASTATAGQHHSRFRGRGVDFQESRIYQPGDDIRSMDWKVTARSGKPHTKLYQEERERPVVLMLDLGPSMFFGTRVAFKSIIAARAAALITWATVTNGDRIGAFFFSGSTHHEIQPGGGRRGAMRVIRDLAIWTNPNHQPREPYGASLSDALQRLRRVARPGSLVYLFSDFYGLDGDPKRHLTRLRQHNDVVACYISDALERAPPPPARYGVGDGHRRGILDTSNRSTLAAYQSYVSENRKRVQELMRSCAVPMLPISTDDNIVDRLRYGLSKPVKSTLDAA